MLDKRPVVFHEKKFQQPKLSQYGEIMENTQMILRFLRPI